MGPLNTVLLGFCLAGLLANVSANSCQVEEKFTGKLKMDTASLNITTALVEPVTVLGIDTNCYQCPLQTLGSNVSDYLHVVVKTRHPFLVVVKITGSTKEICRLNYLFGEYGWYDFDVTPSGSSGVCSLKIIKEPVNSYIPILVAFTILLVLAVLWILYQKFGRIHVEKLCHRSGSGDITEETTKGKDDGTEMNDISKAENPAEPGPEAQPNVKRRLRSLDTFRGIAITLMIFANFGGGGYYFFGHAVWNGLLVADLVFPWFIWIMGVSITLSFRSLRRRRLTKTRILLKIVKRSLILFGLGLFTSNHGTLEFYRIPGVLQRFGICYFVVALMQLYLRPGLEDEGQGRWWHHIRDVLSLWKQRLLMLLVMAIFLVVTYATKVPGCPRGYVGPGGLGEGYPGAFNCTGGVAGYIDRKFLGKHIYRWPTAQQVYKTTLPYDPEGCLGTLTSIVLVFFGVQAGQILATYQEDSQRMLRWSVWGAMLGFMAIGLSGGTTNQGAIPINKNLWSLSFILATASTSFLLLAACYFLTDVKRWWNGAPFFYPGMNSILVYVGHGILQRHFPFTWDLDPYATHAEKLTMAVLGAGLWALISYILYCKKIFLKV